MTAQAHDETVDQDPERVAEKATAVGEERLSRSPADILITGFIGGFEVSLGCLAAAAVMGALLDGGHGTSLFAALALAGLAFPIGFLFVITGSSELFTENFLIPVLGLLNHRRRGRDLVALWGLSWVGNLLGCGAFTALLLVPHAVGDSIIYGIGRYTEYKLSLPAAGSFVSAVLAGSTMTVLTWLVVALRNPAARVVVIWAAGYVLFAANLSHAIVGAALVFTGALHTGRSWGEVAGWLGLATAGNLAGGLAFVTFFRVSQVWEKQRGRGPQADRASLGRLPTTRTRPRPPRSARRGGRRTGRDQGAAV